MNELGRSNTEVPGGADADRSLAAIGAACGLDFRRCKRLPGEHGAVEATVPGSGRFIVKWTRHPAPWQDHVAGVTTALRRRRYPAPRIIAADEVDGLSYLVQEKLPGTPPQELDADQLESLISVVEMHRDGARGLERRGLGWGEQVQRDLADPEHWSLRKRALAGHSPLGARLVADIARRAAALDVSGLPEQDIVHGDFGLGNLLFLPGALSGVVDWDGWRPGDHRADLVTLWFALRIGTDQTCTAARLKAHLRQIMCQELLWLYAAHNVVRTLGWFAHRYGELPSPQWMDASIRLLRATLDQR
ncbi:hypothetical protein GCM10010174_83440 [Kutzneria viridogrisea]|uniref:Aminoglycoside phosphotransferase domain-containing protein n=2 Tax=Kutzneria TaxID=43356 RepID=W5WI29_9PSEU|nr:aminoglycoside phosphotransferase family protein [Kutzneria albida]AHI00237.1 hypothetical protein KALB_6878 [Kutzneria albida DSM 43870]MBA8925413.1 hypothetical protein [Kutzneria viridogrisea]